MSRPLLKIVGLHVEGLRALRRVDWPADGLGWNGTVPDVVVVGGVNGSGKTTLLDFLAASARCLFDWTALPGGTPAWRAVVDFSISSYETGDQPFRLAVGDEPFVLQDRASGLALKRMGDQYAPLSIDNVWNATRSLLMSPEAFARSDFPSVVYLPTDRRFVVPTEAFKSAGKLQSVRDFYYRFQEATTWKSSLEALLYAARFEDLNAKEEGRPQDATHFESYTKAFEAFFGTSKRLVWDHAELFVQVASGEKHGLAELSSGEKQALMLAAELYRRWRPGSLILIDEPELHFHSTWQTAVYEMLVRWQKERGGQVIMATQSTHLFQIADPRSTVLLGRDGLQ